MRSAIIAAAFAVSALAVPYQKEKRALVVETDINVVYVTDYTTTTVQGAAPTDNTTPQAKQAWGWPHRHHHHHGQGGQPPAVPTTTSEAPAPTSTWSSQPTSQQSQPASPSGGGGSPASSAPAPSGTSYQDITLLHHNKHRTNGSAAPLQWDSDLESSAQTIADSCIYAHNL